MESDAINPWQWQDAWSFSQAVDVRGAGRVLFCAGQTSVDADGRALHAGDMAAQLAQAFDNLEAVLAAAGMTLDNVVRLNYYVTDVDAYAAAGQVVAARLQSVAAKPAGVLLGVARLAQKELLVEIEATAVG